MNEPTVSASHEFPIAPLVDSIIAHYANELEAHEGEDPQVEFFCEGVRTFILNEMVGKSNLLQEYAFLHLKTVMEAIDCNATPEHGMHDMLMDMTMDFVTTQMAHITLATVMHYAEDDFDKTKLTNPQSAVQFKTMNTLNKEQMVALKTAIEDCDYSPYYNYSGRGMYGNLCFGFSIDRFTSSSKAITSIIMSMLYNCGDGEEFEDVRDIIEVINNGNIKEDSLGMGTIIYFQDMKYPKDWNDDGEEEEDEDYQPEGEGYTG